MEGLEEHSHTRVCVESALTLIALDYNYTKSKESDTTERLN